MNHRGRCHELHEFLPCDVWDDTLEGRSWALQQAMADAAQAIGADMARALMGMGELATTIRGAWRRTWRDILEELRHGRG